MKINRLFKYSVFCTLVMALLSSCVSRKKIAYFQKDDVKNAFITTKDKLLNINSQDRLTISVSAQEQDAAIPFNSSAAGSSSSNVNSSSNVPYLQVYTVNSEGTIDFPVLGTMKVKGLSIEELRAKLTKEISQYVKTPIVSIELINFRVSVLGEVRSPGTYRIDDQSISLPKALGMAGDMTIYGQRKNILIIREETSGVLTKNYLDITDDRIMDSPYYYLKQNDVVYVEPNRSQRQSAKFNRNTGVYASVFSVLLSLAILFTN